MRRLPGVGCLLLAVAGLSCRPGEAVGRSRAVSTCELWNDAALVVEARVVEFGPTRLMTLGDAQNYPAAPMTIEVLAAHKGAASGRLSVLMGHGLAANGDSEVGNMTNAEGLFWLRRVDGHLVFAGEYFSRKVDGGFFRSNTSTPSDGVLAPESLRALPTTCVEAPVDGGTGGGTP